MVPSSRQSQNLGQIIEYIPDRLYLAAYTQPPTSETLFPYSQAPLSPRKRGGGHKASASASTSSRMPPCYFSIDDSLLYNAFHHDFGPLHIGHLYRFAIQFHEILGAKENKDRLIVFWSQADPRARANAACMLACYMVLIQNWPPHLALAPIAQVDPPLMPFRDAGYSQADYGITIQDVVYGVWKAKDERCCDLDSFDLDMYEKFERVEHGDFNWITPHFLAFASPQHQPVDRITAEQPALLASLPRDLDAVDAHPTLPQPFKNVLRHFSESGIGLVVRLNSALYSPSYFEALGIQHLDMVFDDGTCPALPVVRKFIRLAHETMTVRKKAIAVHCKAGLGRTGCLIGAYLIYRHGFTANEVIAFMRFMRPGMVVGPQQHWLHLNQGTFREWWVEERVERRLRKELAAQTHGAPSTPMRAIQRPSTMRQTSTPPNRSPSTRTPLSEVDNERKTDDCLPAPTPGQPRKAARADRHHPYQRSASLQAALEEEEEEAAGERRQLAHNNNHNDVGDAEEAVVASTRSSRGAIARETEIMTLHRRSQDSASDEELHLRIRSHRTSPGRSPGDKGRSASQAILQQLMDNDSSHDAENIGARSKTHSHVSRIASGPSVMTKVRSKRSNESPLRVKEAGVRKTSGRIGSTGAARKVSSIS